jgi:GNAT superfamily N-acetyltransferase
VAAIYGMSVRPELRGHGIAGDLTETLLEHAKALGCRRVVLHSSEMAVGVSRRAGFVECCPLLFFATAPIWSGKH